MKKFIFKLLGYSLSFLAILGLCALIGFFRFRNFSYKLPEDIHVLFVGDSQIETNINPEFIPNSFNWGKSGQPLPPSYIRAYLILRDNPQIKCVFLGVTYSQLIYRNIPGNNFGPEICYYFPHFNKDEYSRFIYKNKFEVAKNILSMPMTYFLPKKSYLYLMGGIVQKSGQHLKADMELPLKEDNLAEEEHDEKNNSQIYYLKKIKTLCKERGVRLIGISTPYYKFSESKAYHSFIATKDRNWELEFWNYTDWEPENDGFWYDRSHLNKWGAEEFSKVLAERMKREGIITE